MLIKFCQECGAEFQARRWASKNCGLVCGNISARKLKAAKHLAKAGIVRSKGSIVNDERQMFENHVPRMALARQLWNKKFKAEITE